VDTCIPSLSYSSSSVAERFGLENGADLVGKYLSDPQCIAYDDHLLVPDINPVVEYISSLDNEGLLKNQEELDALRTRVQQNFDFTNGFRITKESGLITAKKS
jgi:hypothetical protein